MTDAAPPNPAESTELAGFSGIGHNNPPPPSFSAEITERHGKLKVRLEALKVRVEALPAELTTPLHHDQAVAIVKDFVALERDVTDAHSTEKAPLSEKVKVIDGFFLTRGLSGLIDPLKRSVALKDGVYLEAKAEREREAARQEAARLEAEAQARHQEAADAENLGQNTVAEVKLDAALAAEGDADRAAARAEASTATLARTYSSQGTASLKYDLEVDIDSAAVDLEKLRAYLPLATLQAAAKAWAKMQNVKAETFKKGNTATQPLTGAVFKGVPKSGMR